MKLRFTFFLEGSLRSISFGIDVSTSFDKGSFFDEERWAKENGEANANNRRADRHFFGCSFGGFFNGLGKIFKRNILQDWLKVIELVDNIVFSTYFDWQHPKPGPDGRGILEPNKRDACNIADTIFDIKSVQTKDRSKYRNIKVIKINS